MFLPNTKIKFKAFLTMLFLSFFASTGYSQTDTLNQAEQKNGNLLKVFLDCESCNLEYFQKAIPFVNYVRDRTQAQVHVLITGQSTVSGGTLYDLQFIGQQDFLRENQRLTFTSPQSDTDLRRQEGLSRTLSVGLIQYAAKTNIINDLEIKYNGLTSSNMTQEIEDPWDYWIFNVYLGGNYETEENNNSIQLNGSFNGDRATEESRMRNNFYYELEEENFKKNGNTITSKVKSWGASTSYVKSISEHWSVGGFVELEGTTYRNTELSARIYPGLEYNIFPWSVSTNKVLTLAYYLGFKDYRYIEETIYNKRKETLLFHSLYLESDIRQPWGSFWGTLELSQYPQLKNKFSIKLDTYLSFRVSEGFSFTLGVEAESIHNQLYLVKGNASLEEILLKQRQLETTYNMEFSLGVSYSFGSIYNNIVNKRL